MLMNSPEGVQSNDDSAEKLDSQNSVGQELDLDALGDLYIVAATPESVDVGAEGEEQAFSDILSKLNDGSTIESVKTALKGLIADLGTKDRLTMISTIARAFPGGDMADFYNYLDRSYSERHPNFSLQEYNGSNRFASWDNRAI